MAPQEVDRAVAAGNEERTCDGTYHFDSDEPPGWLAKDSTGLVFESSLT